MLTEHCSKKRKFKSDYQHEKISKRLKTSIKHKKILSNIECLPNEIFYQIFSYLTDRELLNSFCFTLKNKRFDELIRNRTSINFRSIQRSQLIHLIYKNSLINQKILRQIHLFNDDNTPGLINLFFNLYSFDLFPNLKILVLDQPEQTDLIKLMKYFSKLEHLSIRLSTLVRMPSIVYTNLYSSVLCSSLKSLTIIDDPDEPITLPENMSLPYLKNLTLGSLTSFDIQKIFQAAPKLSYFKFHLNSEQSDTQNEQCINTNITRIDIDAPRAEFDLISKILFQTRKLKSLKICCRGESAWVWECFIRSFLPNLIDFRFKFDIRQRNISILEYEQDWWTKVKKWIVIGHPLSSVFYTLPFIDTKLTLNARTAFRQQNCFSSKLSNEYSNIRQLILTLNPLGFKLCQSNDVYFNNIDSLTLIDYKNSQKPVSHLSTLINLINIRHLTIDHRMRSGTFLLLIKEMPQLNSISGQDVAFSAITNKFQNEIVISFLKKNIQKLTISPSKACDDIRYVSQLCVVFSHITHINLSLKWAIDIWPWLKLSNLSSATVFCRHGSFINLINDPANHKWFFNCTYELRSHQDLRLWIQ
ncbi:unnamed protein product [Adineta steineri]|uniref:F-box domain-containing protein n=1 Tax=Adineta steineri TaxID=433720 RepID=A0A815B3K1_9BILA|nr:unnamed protein product [Adineta steineri]CAF1553397.1 unnamed protein product [Adineta steineri]